MQVRGLLVGILVLAVLGGLVWWSSRTETADEKAGDEKKLFTLSNDEVQRMEIADRDGGATTVVEKDKAGWQITAPKPLRADQDSVSSLVTTFTGLTEDRVVEEQGAELGEFGLAHPSLKISANGKQTLLIGDETPTGGGYYAKLDGSPRVFTIAGYSKNSLDKDWRELRDKRLLTFEEDKLTRVELAARGGAVEFGRNAQKEWQIVRPRPLRADNYATEELVRKLKDARMDSEPDETEAALSARKFAGGSRVATATVTDSSGTQTIEVRKSGDEYFARSSAVEGIHKVDTALGEALNKTLDDFRNRKLFDFGFADPTKIDMRDGTTQYSFVKGGEKWWSNGQEMDAASVQSTIDRLRDLTASGFAEAGMRAPEIEISVTSNDGKRTEKVNIAKSGAGWLAQREGEPALYRLEDSAVEELRKAAADVKAPPPPPTPPADGGK